MIPDRTDKSILLLQNPVAIHKSSEYTSWVSSQAGHLGVNGVPRSIMG